jgi:hypothetical protein
MDISAIERVNARITIATKLADGSRSIPDSVSLALLPLYHVPTAATLWFAPLSYSGGVAIKPVAGPSADPTGALVVPPAGADLWVRWMGGDGEVVIAKADRITIKG